MLKTSLSLLLGAALAAPLSSQACSKLAVDGTGKPGTDITFTLTGATAEAAAVLFLSTQTGKTTIGLGALGSVDLGLARPLIPVTLGMTDKSGDVSLKVSIPDATIPEISLHGQGTTVQLELGKGRPKVVFCESNVAAFKLGG